MEFSNKFLENAEILLEILKEYPKIVEEQKEKLDEIYKLMDGAKKLHIHGKGRSSSAAASLALRLKQFHYNVWYMGDYVTERIVKGDVVMLFSGSGETLEIVDIARKARMDEAKVIAITSYDNSTLAKNSDLVFILPGGMEKGRGWKYLETQLTKERVMYGGGMFELYAYLFQETLITTIGRYKNIPGSTVAEEHIRDEIISS